MLSVAVQVAAEVEHILDVPPSAFWPPPKVTSAVVRCRLRPYPGFAEVDKRAFFRVVKAAFGQRRKTLGNSLAGGLGLEKEVVAEVLRQAGIDDRRRAESLSIDEYLELTRAFQVSRALKGQ